MVSFTAFIDNYLTSLCLSKKKQHNVVFRKNKTKKKERKKEKNKKHWHSIGRYLNAGAIL